MDKILQELETNFNSKNINEILYFSLENDIAFKFISNKKFEELMNNVVILKYLDDKLNIESERQDIIKNITEETNLTNIFEKFDDTLISSIVTIFE